MPKSKEIQKSNTIIDSNIDSWQNLRTGEIIEATQITKKLGRQGFMITYLSAIVNLIEVLGNKKMQVVKYILSNMETSNNSLIITTKELAQKSGVSEPTVLETLKILEKSDIIRRRVGAIMINSNLAHKGSENKEKALIARFQAFNGLDEK